MGRKRHPRRAAAPQLVLNGSEQRLQLVLAEDGEVLAAEELAVGGSAMQHLAPALEGLLARLDIGPKQLTGIACLRGPGSFTGLRMVLAMALGLARAADLPLAGLPTLPLIAAGPVGMLTGTLTVITHSRSHQVYLQAFTAPGGQPLDEPRPLPLEAAAEAITALPGPVFAVGSGLRNNAEFFARELPQLRALDPGFDHPLPHALARAAADAAYGPEAIEPLYLRASDAEDNLASIAENSGLSADEAHARLEAATSGLTGPSCPGND